MNILYLLVALAALGSLQATAAADQVTINVVTSHTEVDSDGFVRDRKVRRRVPKTDGPLSTWTSFRTGDGLSLDPTTVRFVVVPRKYKHLLGCAVVVRNPKNGRAFVAVAGDVGNRFGEVSIKLAHDLDHRTSSWSGIGHDVSYTFLPGIKIDARSATALSDQLAGLTTMENSILMPKNIRRIK